MKLPPHASPLPPQKPGGKINPKEIRKSYLEKMEGELESRGVVFFDQNSLNIMGEYLVLPSEVTEISSKELGEYLNAFTQQKMYLRTLLGRIELKAEEARRKYFEASDPVYRDFSATKMSETAKDRLVNADEAVQELYYKYTDYKKQYSILELNILNIEDAIFMISREVTRRTGDFSDENRNHNVGRR
jgi:hypothetical protein